MSRKRNHRMSPALRQRQQRGETRYLDAQQIASWNQPLTEAEVLRLMNTNRAALIRMIEGTAGEADYKLLGGEVNVLWIRAEKVGGGELVQQRLEAAGAALTEAHAFKARHGYYSLTTAGANALGEGVDVMEPVYLASTPMDLHRAEQVLQASLAALRKKQRA